MDPHSPNDILRLHHPALSLLSTFTFRKDRIVTHFQHPSEHFGVCSQCSYSKQLPEAENNPELLPCDIPVPSYGAPVAFTITLKAGESLAFYGGCRLILHEGTLSTHGYTFSASDPVHSSHSCFAGEHYVQPTTTPPSKTSACSSQSDSPISCYEFPSVCPPVNIVSTTRILDLSFPSWFSRTIGSFVAVTDVVMTLFSLESSTDLTINSGNLDISPYCFPVTSLPTDEPIKNQKTNQKYSKQSLTIDIQPYLREFALQEASFCYFGLQNIAKLIQSDFNPSAPSPGSSESTSLYSLPPNMAQCDLVLAQLAEMPLLPDALHRCAEESNTAFQSLLPFTNNLPIIALSPQQYGLAHISARLSQINAYISSPLRTFAFPGFYPLLVNRAYDQFGKPREFALLAPTVRWQAVFCAFGDIIRNRLRLACQWVHSINAMITSLSLGASQVNSHNTPVQSLRPPLPPSPSLIICGGRNHGKSTFCQFLCNYLLSPQTYADIAINCCPLAPKGDDDKPKHDSEPQQPQSSPIFPFPCVALMETDVGQAFNALSGVVSIQLLTSPILRPSFDQQSWNITFSAVFGSNSIDFNPHGYRAAIQTVFARFCKFQQENNVIIPLIINTPGWVTGLGKKLLLDTIDLTQPDIIVELNDKLSPSIMSNEELQAHQQQQQQQQQPDIEPNDQQEQLPTASPSSTDPSSLISSAITTFRLHTPDQLQCSTAPGFTTRLFYSPRDMPHWLFSSEFGSLYQQYNDLAPLVDPSSSASPSNAFAQSFASYLDNIQTPSDGGNTGGGSSNTTSQKSRKPQPITHLSQLQVYNTSSTAAATSSNTSTSNSSFQRYHLSTSFQTKNDLGSGNSSVVSHQGNVDIDLVSTFSPNPATRASLAPSSTSTSAPPFVVSTMAQFFFTARRFIQQLCKGSTNSSVLQNDNEMQLQTNNTMSFSRLGETLLQAALDIIQYSPIVSLCPKYTNDFAQSVQSKSLRTFAPLVITCSLDISTKLRPNDSPPEHSIDPTNIDNATHNSHRQISLPVVEYCSKYMLFPFNIIPCSISPSQHAPLHKSPHLSQHFVSCQLASLYFPLPTSFALLSIASVALPSITTSNLGSFAHGWLRLIDNTLHTSLPVELLPSHQTSNKKPLTNTTPSLTSYFPTQLLPPIAIKLQPSANFISSPAVIANIEIRTFAIASYIIGHVNYFVSTLSTTGSSSALSPPVQSPLSVHIPTQVPPAITPLQFDTLGHILASNIPIYQRLTTSLRIVHANSIWLTSNEYSKMKKSRKTAIKTSISSNPSIDLFAQHEPHQRPPRVITTQDLDLINGSLVGLAIWSPDISLQLTSLSSSSSSHSLQSIKPHPDGGYLFLGFAIIRAVVYNDTTPSSSSSSSPAAASISTSPWPDTDSNAQNFTTIHLSTPLPLHILQQVNSLVILGSPCSSLPSAIGFDPHAPLSLPFTASLIPSQSKIQEQLITPLSSTSPVPDTAALGAKKMQSKNNLVRNTTTKK